MANVEIVTGTLTQRYPDQLEAYRKLGIVELFQQFAEKYAATHPDMQIEFSEPDHQGLLCTLSLSWLSPDSGLRDQVTCHLNDGSEGQKVSFSRNNHAVVRTGLVHTVIEANSVRSATQIRSWDIGFRAFCKRTIEAGLTAEL